MSSYTVQKVLDNFDFEKTAKIMEMLNHTWHGGKTVTPFMLLNAATEMFRVMEQENVNSVATGGLFAVKETYPSGTYYRLSYSPVTSIERE